MRDLPFLVDSLLLCIDRQHLNVHMLVHTGNLSVERDSHDKITKVTIPKTKEKVEVTEALIHIEIDRQPNQEAVQSLREQLLNIIQDVTWAVDDWQEMNSKLQGIVKSLEDKPQYPEQPNLKDSVQFLHWLLDDHFIFLGYREYTVSGEGGDKGLWLTIS